jgi:hypothetical protein
MEYRNMPPDLPPAIPSGDLQHRKKYDLFFEERLRHSSQALAPFFGAIAAGKAIFRRFLGPVSGSVLLYACNSRVF